MWNRKKKRKKSEAAGDMKEMVRQLKRSKKGLGREELEEIVTGACEQLGDLNRQIVFAQQEYEAVTAYLTDMQKIDRMEGKTRQEINDAARNIINLNRERNHFQNNGTRINAEQYWIMERYEKEIPKELDHIYEQEQYRSLVESDLRQLEGERGVILYEKEQAEDKKSVLQKIAIATISLVVLLFLTLLFVGNITETNMTLPLLMTTALAVIVAVYIVLTASKCDHTIKASEYRMNRVIQLVNKVKIKLVNCAGSLDYIYEKYQVESYQELQWLWERYVKTRDEERRYRKSAELLSHNQEQLVQLLKKEELADPDIWIYQLDALLDEKEMVEIRHHLNTRRQKIRERLEFNQKQEEQCTAELLALRDSQPAYRDLIERILGEYGIARN
ncbi:MAG: hypothetical protein IJY09_06100 [Lachnospiraceae bacterium]|nr:hypothetical protein [Lachnospiraceae bacterium]